MKHLFLFIIYLGVSSAISAQSDDSKSYGEPIVKIFANYNHGLSSELSEKTAFEVQRAYLGYQYNFDKHWKSIVKLDIGSPGNLSEYSFLGRFGSFKNAYIKYVNERWTLKLGMADMHHIGFPEKIWGHRYIMKEFQDRYKFAPKADIGISSQYHLNNFITLDAFVVNGEGNKSIQKDNTYKYGGGISLKSETGFRAHFHYDITPKETIQHSLSCFLGYIVKNKTAIGMEGAYQINSRSNINEDMYGYSFFGMYHLNTKWELFARYDKVYSNILQHEANPWNQSKDGTAIIGGIQYHLSSFLKFALNYQNWICYDKNEANTSYIYINMEVAL